MSPHLTCAIGFLAIWVAVFVVYCLAAALESVARSIDWEE